MELSVVATDDLRSNADVFHLFAFFGELWLIAQKQSSIFAVKLIPLVGELWLNAQKPYPSFAVKLIPLVALVGESVLRGSSGAELENNSISWVIF